MAGKRLGVLFALMTGVATAWPQDRPAVPWKADAPHLQLTGNARIDLIGRMDLADEPRIQDETSPQIETHRKSPWLAAGMSVLVPGAGEFYTESYWKSAAFFAVEVAAWVIAYTNAVRTVPRRTSHAPTNASTVASMVTAM